VLAIGFIGGFAANAGGFAASWNKPPPPLLASASADAPVVTRQYDDAQPVTLQLRLGPDRVLQAPRSGRLTSFNCAVGQALDSGKSHLSVDGAPAVSLATKQPPWRDLGSRAAGKDVLDLSRELVRLGYLEATTSANSELLRAAWNELAGARGAAHTWNKTIPFSGVAWLPADGITVTACDVAVGAQVTRGQRLAKLAPALLGAALAEPPPSGDRVLVIGDQEFALTDGAIADKADLARLAALAEVQRALAGNLPVAGTSKLAQPITISVVPPAAVGIAADGAACVIGDATPRPVQVVGSQLGQTLVVFDGAPPTTVTLNPSPSCT